jgi:hypothetical protein
MNISEALVIGEQTNGAILDQDEWVEFAEAVEIEVAKAIDAAGNRQDIEDEVEALKQTFRDLAAAFFVTGVVWRDAQESPEGSADFTVVVDTIPFLATLVNNQSLTVRFALANDGEQG